MGISITFFTLLEHYGVISHKVKKRNTLCGITPDYQNLLFGLPNTLRKKYPCKSVFQAAYKNNNFLPHYQYVHYITGSIFEQYL